MAPRRLVDRPHVRSEAFRIGVGAVIGLWLTRHLLKALWWLARRPLVWLLAATVVTVWRLATDVGTWAPITAAGGTAVLLVVWRLVHAASFRLVVWWRLRARWRKVFVYRREWDAVMTNLGLTVTRNGAGQVPAIRRVKSTATVDKVRVRMLPGQVLADFAKNADRLAQTFEALDCRVRTVRRRTRRGGHPRVVELWFLVSDPLTDLVPLFDVPAKPNLKAIPVALGEDGLAWTLRLLAMHWLIVGATGAGKGSVLWSILRGLGHGIRTGLVQVWALDPKGGMELGLGERLFTRFCYGRLDELDVAGRQAPYELAFAEMLEGAVQVMRERQDRMRGRLRAHKPSVSEPLIVIVIDELANLTAYVVDREAKQRIAAALAALLTQGRAVGITVIAALQDPRKEVLPARGLFPGRIALRLNEAGEVDLALGDGARDQGARCDEIPDDLPGVGFVTEDGRPEPIRVRFGYIDDDEIATMCSLYAPGTPDYTAPGPGGGSGLRLVHDADRDDGEEVA